MRLHPHNHDLNSYKTELYSLKNKCKDESRIFRESLSIVFRDTTRSVCLQPRGVTICFFHVSIVALAKLAVTRLLR